MSFRVNDLVKILRCPSCGSPLLKGTMKAEKSIKCDACGSSFDIDASGMADLMSISRVEGLIASTQYYDMDEWLAYLLECATKSELPAYKVDNDEEHKDPVHRAIVKKYLEFCSGRNGYVLDVGAGATIRATHFFGMNYIALDPLADIENKEGRGCSIRGIGEDIPLINETCARVIGVNVLQYALDVKVMISEMVRVLRRYGHLFLIMRSPQNGDTTTSVHDDINSIRDMISGDFETLDTIYADEFLYIWGWKKGGGDDQNTDERE